jgi:hypothetical protein
MLCHLVLPYSNWEWATVCHSESMAALRRGVQEAVFRLGRVTEYHQTDNSTAATHKLGGETKERGFNEEYLALMRHLELTPRTIQVGEKHQNGDVESLNGALKVRVRSRHLVSRRDLPDPWGMKTQVNESLRSVPASEARELLKEQMQSDLSIAAFARSKGVKPWSLYNAKAVTRRRARGTSESRFAEVQVVDRVAEEVRTPLELALPSGICVRVQGEFDEVVLRRLLGVLASC